LKLQEIIVLPGFGGGLVCAVPEYNNRLALVTIYIVQTRWVITAQNLVGNCIH